MKCFLFLPLVAGLVFLNFTFFGYKAVTISAIQFASADEETKGAEGDIMIARIELPPPPPPPFPPPPLVCYFE